jgi:predicted RNase H-like nuclease (RuvC/YqgF family)
VVVVEEKKEEIKKESVIISIDPGFIKLGLAILDSVKGTIIETRCI